MINTIVNDIVNSATSAFHGSDTPFLVIMALVALLVGLRCNSVAHIFSHGLETLLLTGIANAVYHIAWPTSSMPSNVDGWSSALAGKWDRLMSFSLDDLLGLYVVAVVALLVVFLVKQLIVRR